MLTQRSVSEGADRAAREPSMWLRHSGPFALLAVSVGWAFMLALVLRHSIFVTNDSLNNYAHVWYISDRLWHGHGVPLHMPVLAHGEAYAFPYAFIPWFSAALLRPLFGDWTVTLWLVLGFLGTVAAMWWAFPEVRGGWWFALLLIEPMLVESVLLGQLPFLWGTAFLFAAIACWRGSSPVSAAVLLGLAAATHPAVIVPIAAVLVVARLYFEPDRPKLLAVYIASLAIAAPAIWLTVASPTVGESSRTELLGNFFGTVILRAIVIASPFIALAVLRTPLARLPAAIFVALISLNAILVPVRHNEFAWGAVNRDADSSFEPFFSTPAFTPGATYRLLRVADGKVGMYETIRHGGRLDSEFFPESIDRRSWPDTDEYAQFLRKRRVDYVIIFDNYDARYHTNEHELLDVLVSGGGRSGYCAARMPHGDGYDIYRVGVCEPV